jgi:hypothetical protein
MSRGKFPGMAGYVELMALLRARPSTIPEFRHRHGLSYLGAYSLVMGLRTLGRVHVCAWRLAARVRPMAVFAFGHQADAEAPQRTLRGKRSRGGALPAQITPSSNMIAVDRVLRVIEIAPATMDDMIEASGISRVHLRTALLPALERHGFAHISGWGAGVVAKYSYGRGVPAPKPDRLRVRSVVNARYWAKRRDRLAAERTMLEAA